jgi:hypothetical protein
MESGPSLPWRLNRNGAAVDPADSKETTVVLDEAGGQQNRRDLYEKVPLILFMSVPHSIGFGQPELNRSGVG